MGDQYLDKNGNVITKSANQKSLEALASKFAGRKQEIQNETPNTVSSASPDSGNRPITKNKKTSGQMLQEQIEARRKSMADSAGAEPRSYSTPESESSGYSGRAAGAKSAGEAYSSYEPGTSDEDKESHE